MRESVIEMVRSRWRRVSQGDVWPVMPLLFIQFCTGAWILTQMSFFPIYLEEELLYAPMAIAAVIAIGQASGLVAALLGGGLTDAWGSKRVLVLGLLGSMIASLVFQTQLALLVALLWGLAGVAASLQTLGGSSYLTRMAAPQQLGLVSALFALSLTLGGALGSPLAGRLLDTAGFRLYGLAGLAILAITALWAIVMLPAQAPDGHEQQRSRANSSMLELTRRPLVRLLIGLRYLPTVYYGLSSVMIPLMINQLAGNKSTVAIYSTISLVVASAAQLLAGRAADHFGHRWPTLIGYAALSFSALGLAFFAGNLGGVFLFGILGNAAAWALATLFFCLVSDAIPRAEHGRAFGLMHATWSIAMISGAVLGGALTRFSVGLPFFAAGLLNSVAILLVLAFFRRLGSEGAAAEATVVQELETAVH